MDKSQNKSKDISKLKKLTHEQRLEIGMMMRENLEKSDLPILGMSEDGLGGLVRTEYKDDKEQHGSIQWRVGQYGDIEIAAVVPKNQKSSQNYLEDINEYDETGKSHEDLIKLSRKTIKYEGVVASTIEALCEIPSLGGWFIYEPDEELRKLLYSWARNINAFGAEEVSDSVDAGTPAYGMNGIEQLAISILHTMYSDGDAFITEMWDYVPVPELQGAKRNLPVSYTFHDAMYVKINETLAKMGRKVIQVEIDDDIVSLIKDGGDSDEDRKILEYIPREVKDAVMNGGDGGTYYTLPASLTSHFSRNLNNTIARGTPYPVKAFPAIAYKHRLRALDNATIDGLIQRVWIVKVGHDDVASPMHQPDPERFKLAVATIRKLTVNNMLVWNGPDLSMEELGSSENNVLSFQDRYKSADEDISLALGFPRMLIDGSGTGNKSSDQSVYVKTVSQMERYQIMLKYWIERQMRRIAVENGYKDAFPKFYWLMMKMQDRERAKNVVTKLYEDGAMGVVFMLNMLGLPAWEIIEQSQWEKDTGLQDTMAKPSLPFTRDGGRPDDTRDGDGDNPRKKNNTPDPDSRRDNRNK